MKIKIENHIQKVRSLLWSNQEQNDWLVLEIVKNYEFPKALLSDFVCVAITSQSEEVSTAYHHFLKQHLSFKESALIAVYRNSNYLSDRRLRGLKRNISTINICQFLLTHFKRTGQSQTQFLVHSDEASPYRNEVFSHYLQRISNNFMPLDRTHSLFVEGLTEEECHSFFQEESIYSRYFHTVVLSTIKATHFPGFSFTCRTLKKLIIRKCNFTNVFPSIFNLNKLETLQIENTSIDSIPEDWSRLKGLETLVLYNCNIHFTSLSFITTMPNLITLELDGNTLVSPQLLMTPKPIPIKKWSELAKIIKYPVNAMTGFASALYQSALSLEDKHYFFDVVKECKSIYINFPDLPLSYLIKALMIDFAPIRKVCWKALQKETEKKEAIKTLNQYSVVYVTGTTQWEQNEIYDNLDNRGISCSFNLTEDVTHIVLGNFPEYLDYRTAQNVIWMTKKQLKELYE